MEIDITAFVTSADPFDFSASMVERGPNAGPETWRNAVREGTSRPLLTTDAQIDAARDYFREFGAWSREEIAAWSADEVNGLLIQYISGNLRELDLLASNDDGDIDWEEAERLAQAGAIHGDIYPGTDGRIYFTMSH